MTKQKEEMQIAQTIIQQIEAGARLGFVMQTVSTKRSKVALDQNEERRGGLHFTLRAGGGHWLWKVVIELDWMDTYRMKLVKINRKTFEAETIVEHEQVYCDMLTELVMDYAVEAKVPHVRFN